LLHCFVQVCNPTRPDIYPHLATVVAGDFVADHESKETGDIHTGAQTQSCIVAHISAVLACNLGLDYHLAPFLDQIKSHPASSCELSTPPGVALVSSRIIKIQKTSWSLLDSAEHKAAGTAEAVWLAKVRSPSLSIIGCARQPQGQHDSSASGNSAGTEVDGYSSSISDASSSSEDNSANEIVRALQRHFQHHPR